MYDVLFAVCSFFFCCILYIYILCTVHRTVISTDYFSITKASFFVLLGSFAVGEAIIRYTVKLKTYFLDFHH